MPPESSVDNATNCREKLKEVLERLSIVKAAERRFEEATELQALIVSAQNELIKSLRESYIVILFK